MSKDYNKSVITGRLGKDPEIKKTGTTTIANFSMAVGDDYKDKSGNKVEKTNWINVVAFGKLAEIIGQYVKKGSKILIEGKIVVDTYQKDGQDRISVKVQANEMQMLDSRGQGDGNNAPQQNYQGGGGGGFSAPQRQSAPAPQANPQFSEDFDDDIPF